MASSDANYAQQDNLDPITGTPGAHPVGTGVGAALGGAAAGALTGSAVGPLGTLVGASLGAIVGGLAGKSIAESADSTREDAYWRANHTERPYIEPGVGYDDYGPAYRYGVNAFNRNPGIRFEEVEDQLSRDWSTERGQSNLDWARARDAARDAWYRVGGQLPLEFSNPKAAMP